MSADELPEEDEARAELDYELGTTQRGFAYLTFIDFYGERCSPQESSLAFPPCIWIGRHENRMHLTQAQVAELLPALHLFVERGVLS